MFTLMLRLRTPNARFAGLPEFPYSAHYSDVSDGEGNSLRMAWVQDGPADADPVLMLHGEPSWSYLYRKMIPVLAAAGHRVICPDLIGFGRSDKPTILRTTAMRVTSSGSASWCSTSWICGG